MEVKPIRNALVCSYRLFHRIAQGGPIPYLYNGRVRTPAEIIPDAACPDWEAYSFDEHGTMTTIIISDWYPEKPSLWRRMLRSVWKRC